MSACETWDKLVKAVEQARAMIAAGHLEEAQMHNEVADRAAAIHAEEVEIEIREAWQSSGLRMITRAVPGPGYACSCGSVPCDPSADTHLFVVAEAVKALNADVQADDAWRDWIDDLLPDNYAGGPLVIAELEKVSSVHRDTRLVGDGVALTSMPHPGAEPVWMTAEDARRMVENTDGVDWRSLLGDERFEKHYETAKQILAGDMLAMEATVGQQIEPPLVSLPVQHDLGIDGVTCRKCKRTREQITEDPHAECLLMIDFSDVTKGLVGGR